MRHYEVSGLVNASAAEAFALLDEHTRLSAHMSKSSWKMGGGSMDVELDAAAGKREGARIRLHGRVFGMQLSVEEVVVERAPPLRKVWQTVGEPRLLIIASYRLGFEVTPGPDGAFVRVFIDYSLPAGGLSRWLGVLLGDRYARWCTHQMLEGAAKHFSERTRPTHAAAPGV
jgi:hypothetical protein